MLNKECCREFANGVVYLLRTDDGMPLEVTDTFLPYYTKNAIKAEVTAGAACGQLSILREKIEQAKRLERELSG